MTRLIARSCFPFGHGLSYHSSFISVVEIQPPKTTSSIANTPVAILSFMVQNAGKVGGRESVQIYVARSDGIGRFPEKELRDFIKVELGAGEKKTCSVQLTMEAFAYSDTSANNSTVAAGDYKFLPGSSSRKVLTCSSKPRQAGWNIPSSSEEWTGKLVCTAE